MIKAGDTQIFILNGYISFYWIMRIETSSHSPFSPLLPGNSESNFVNSSTGVLHLDNLV